jgi:serine protease
MMLSLPAHAQEGVTAPRSGMARVIVKFRAGSGTVHALSASKAGATGQRYPQRAATLSQRAGVALSDGRPIGDDAQVVFAPGLTSAELAARLAADPQVEFAEPDRRRQIRAAPNDPLYRDGQTKATPVVGQWYLRAPAAGSVSAIDAAGAWATTTGSSGVVVAVLDTGVRFDHPDLVGKLLAGYDFIADLPTARDGNGRDADASDPGDWITRAEDNDRSGDFYHCSVPDPVTGAYDGEDSSWHGTQVAGIIGAATHNRIGMASVGRNVMVLPVRVLGKCGGWDSDIQAAMLWAAGLSNNPVKNPHPAKVLNLSLGSAEDEDHPGCPAGYQQVISKLTAAGVVLTASAGNGEGLAVDVPALCPGVIAVAGVRHAGTKVGYSSLGPEVAIAAPAGNCVNATGPCLNPLLTTTNAGTTTPARNTYSDGVVSSLGTSFSAPLVAGTAALMLSVEPTLTPAEVRTALMDSARPFPAGGVAACHAPNGAVQDECACTTSTCGAGLLDAAAAVARVAPTLAPTAPFSASDANPAVGDKVTFDARDATVGAGRTGTYRWTLSDPDIAHFSSATNAATATLIADAPGTLTVTLTVTDDLGTATSASTGLTLGATTLGLSGSHGGGGGGALGWHWLLALAAAVAILRRQRASMVA